MLKNPLQAADKRRLTPIDPMSSYLRSSAFIGGQPFFRNLLTEQ